MEEIDNTVRKPEFQSMKTYVDCEVMSQLGGKYAQSVAWPKTMDVTNLSNSLVRNLSLCI